MTRATVADILTADDAAPVPRRGHHPQTVRLAMFTAADGEPPIGGVAYTCDYADREHVAADLLHRVYRAAAADPDLHLDPPPQGGPSQAELTRAEDAAVTFNPAPPDADLDTDTLSQIAIRDAKAQGLYPLHHFRGMSRDQLRARLTAAGAPTARTIEEMAQTAHRIQKPTWPYTRAAVITLTGALALPRPGTDSTFVAVIDALTDAAAEGTLMVSLIPGDVATLRFSDYRDYLPGTRALVLAAQAAWVAQHAAADQARQVLLAAGFAAVQVAPVNPRAGEDPDGALYEVAVTAPGSTRPRVFTLPLERVADLAPEG